jgi:hypothetical protein
MRSISMNSRVIPTTPRANRRQFLIASGGAALAAAVALRGEFPLPSSLERLADLPGPRIPVAFVAGSAGAVSLAAALATRDARALPAVGLRPSVVSSGDASVAFHGFAGGPESGAAQGYARVLVDALVPSPVIAGETIPFYAWTFRNGPSPSRSLVSAMRVGASHGLRVGVSIDAAPIAATSGAAPGVSAPAVAASVADGAAAVPSTVVFSSRAHRRLPTFQPGVYLLGLEQGMWSSPTALPAIDDPAWSSLPSMVVVVEESTAD